MVDFNRSISNRIQKLIEYYLVCLSFRPVMRFEKIFRLEGEKLLPTMTKPVPNNPQINNDL